MNESTKPIKGTHNIGNLSARIAKHQARQVESIRRGARVRRPTLAARIEARRLELELAA